MGAQLTVATADGRSFVRPIDKDEFTIGRDSRNHLVLGDRQVSKYHCIIVSQKDHYTIKDLGSSNGTLVNGIRVDGEIAVTSGDRMRVGPYDLIFGGGTDEPSYLRFKPGSTPSTGEAATPANPSLPSSPGAPTAPTPRWDDGRPVTPPPSGRPRSVKINEPTPTPALARGPEMVSATDSGMAPQAGRAYLEILDGDGKGHMITVGSRGITIGAGSRNHLVLDDSFVSRQHARVDKAKDGYTVRDLGSTNGIRIDGRDLTEAELTDGTKVQVGGVLMVFRWPNQPAETSQIIHDLPAPRAHPHAPSQPASVTPVARPVGGRSSVTMQQMNAVGMHTLSIADQEQTPRPEVKTAAIPHDEQGVVSVGGLRFKRWMLAVMGFIGVIIFGAVLLKVALGLFAGGGGTGVVTSQDLLNAGLEAYRGGDWDTAEAYLDKIDPALPEGLEAQKYLDNIHFERENAERVETVATLMDEGFFHRAFEISQEIPPTSRYHEEAQDFVALAAAEEATRLLAEASTLLQEGNTEEAIVLLDRAESYSPDVPGLAEMREAIEQGDTSGKTVPTPHTADQGSRPQPVDAGSTTIDAALATYLAGDVSGSRTSLDKTISKTSDAGTKLEAQEIGGRIDRIEGALAAGNKAMDAGDLDVALDRFESGYRDITRLDTGGNSERRSTVRQALAECRYRRGREAFDRRRYSRANHEWTSGRKAWPSHPGIKEGRSSLEEIAKDIYGDAYMEEKEGSERSVQEARRLYEQVMEVAPKGDGFKYYDKAKTRLEEL